MVHFATDDAGFTSAANTFHARVRHADAVVQQGVQNAGPRGHHEAAGAARQVDLKAAFGWRCGRRRKMLPMHLLWWALAGRGLVGRQHGRRTTGIEVGVGGCGLDDGGQVQHFSAGLLVKVQVQLPQSPGGGLQILQMRNEGRTRTGAGAVVHHPRGLALVELRRHGHQGCDANATSDQHHRRRTLDQRKVVARWMHLDRVTGFELLMDPARPAPALRVFLHRHPIAVHLAGCIQQGITAGQPLGQYQVNVGPGTGGGQRRWVGGAQVIGENTFGLPSDRFHK